MSNSPQHQSYAPFGSVSMRVKKSKKKQIQPGPGTYEISLPLIHPIVQTIRKKNNNVIVKLGHIGTAPFQGESNRFPEEHINNPVGPGQYNPQQNKLTEMIKHRKHRSVAVQKIKSLIKYQPERRAAISPIRQMEIEDYVQMPTLQKKDSPPKSKEKVRGSVWSRMSEPRDGSLKFRSVSNIGPGEYDVNARQLSKSEAYPTAAFKSQSVRSFFDQIYFETNQDKLAKQREESGFKRDMIGPGSYHVEHKIVQKHKYQFFGSTEERKL